MNKSIIIALSIFAAFIIYLGIQYWYVPERQAADKTPVAVHDPARSPWFDKQILLRRDASSGSPRDRVSDPLSYRDFDPIPGPILPDNPFGYPRILVVLRANFYPAIKDSIDTYFQDLINDGYWPKLIQFDATSQSVEELKSILITEYQSGGLEGAVMVGDLPVAMVEQLICNATETYPSDYYFMDLVSEDAWLDVNDNGIYDVIPKDGYFATAEIWVSRIHTTNLMRSDGTKAADDDAMLINAYFARNHSFRTGPYLSKSLDGNVKVFKDDEFIGSLSPKLYHGDYLYRKDRHDFSLGYNETVATNFEQAIKQPYDWFNAVAHGNENFIGFKHGLIYDSPDKFTAKQLREAVPQSYFVYLESCGPGRFTAEDYFAGWFLFGYDEQPRGMVALAHTDTFSTTAPLSFSFKKKMREGQSVGKAWLVGNWPDDYTRVLLGDGALRPFNAIQWSARAPMDGSEPRLVKLLDTTDPLLKPAPEPQPDQLPDLIVKDVVFEYFDAAEMPAIDPYVAEGLEQSLNEGQWLRIKVVVQYLPGDKGDVFVGEYGKLAPLKATDVVGLRVKYGPQGNPATVAPFTKEIYLEAHAKSLHFGKPVKGLPEQVRILTSPTLVFPVDEPAIENAVVSYMVEVEVDPNNKIEESLKDNNTMTAWYTTGSNKHLKPDLEFVDAGVYTASYEVGLGALKKNVNLFTSAQLVTRNLGPSPVDGAYKGFLYGQEENDGFFTTSPGSQSKGEAKREITYSFVRHVLLAVKKATGQDYPLNGTLKAAVNPENLDGAMVEVSYNNNTIDTVIPLVVPLEIIDVPISPPLPIPIDP